MEYSIGKIKLDLTNNDEKATEEPFYIHKNLFFENGGQSTQLETELTAIKDTMQHIVNELCNSGTTLTATHLIYDTIID